jgi:predicted GNAT family N-acyltransferase
VFEVSLVTWESGRDRLLAVRRAVFTEEQGVDPALESDHDDDACLHVLALDASGRTVGAARLRADGRVGRMAVLAPWRRQGVGAQLLQRLLQECEAAGLARTYLHSQSHAIGFYEKFGFVAQGDEFAEAGIPHVMMVRDVRGG